MTAVTLGKTDAEFQQWITQLDPRQLLRCQWNYYGDMSFDAAEYVYGAAGCCASQSRLGDRSAAGSRASPTREREAARLVAPLP